jgi:hypothetical protein
VGAIDQAIRWYGVLAAVVSNRQAPGTLANLGIHAFVTEHFVFHGRPNSCPLFQPGRVNRATDSSAELLAAVTFDVASEESRRLAHGRIGQLVIQAE